MNQKLNVCSGFLCSSKPWRLEIINLFYCNQDEDFLTYVGTILSENLTWFPRKVLILDIDESR